MIYIFLILLTTTLLFNFIAVRQTVKYAVSPEHKIIFLGILIFLTILLYVYQFFNSYFSEKFSYSINLVLSYVVYYFLAFVIYAGMIYFLIILVSFIFRGKINPHFFQSLYPLALGVVIIILALGTFFKRSTVIKEYKINGADYNLSSPMNVVLVSDVHFGYINGVSDGERLAEKVNALNPDVVLIAGDLVDMHLKPVMEKNMLSTVEKIESRHGVFFALGNHDIYDNKSNSLTQMLRERGINVVRDEKILVDDKFFVAGRDNFSKKPLKEILEGADEKPVLLMQHTPDSITEAVENKVFLQVSGHTHKGQMFPGRLFTKRIFLLDYGYKKFDDTNVIVSSGYGTWGPPIRVGSRSEICLIKIR